MKTKSIRIPILIVLIFIASYYGLQYKKKIDLNKKNINQQHYQDLFPNKFSETYQRELKDHQRKENFDNVDPQLLPSPREKIDP